MGAWGTAIFSNDDAADIRDDFREHIAAGLSPAEATQRIVGEYSSGGPDDNDLWLALAATQHRLGHVAPGVFETALRIVDDADELERWEPADRKKRLAALVKLRELLTSEPPPAKVIRPRKLESTDLELGQHLLYTEASSGSQLIFRVIGFHVDKGGRSAIFSIVDWDGSAALLETPDELALVDFENWHNWTPRIAHIRIVPVGRQPKKENFRLLESRAEPKELISRGTIFMRWDHVIDHVRERAVTLPPTINDLGE